MKQRAAGSLLFLILSISLSPFIASAQAQNSMLRIFYFRDTPIARASLFTHPSSIDVLSPQSYSVDNTGQFVGSIDQKILDFAKKNNIKVMPLVTNRSFSRKTASAILDDAMKEDIAITGMLSEAALRGYWGWQIDFEEMDASYKDRFSDFITKLHEAFKAHNLVLSVAVMAQVSTNKADYRDNLWNDLIGVYDYAALGASADFISVMIYDDPESKSAVAPYPWLVRVVNYSLQSIPSSKLSLGLPLYYWKWNDKSGKLVDVGGYEKLTADIKKKKVTYGYNKDDEIAYAKFTDKKISYSLWYENPQSVARKIDLIKQYQLSGFSAWALGQEDPSLHSVFAPSLISQR